MKLARELWNDGLAQLALLLAAPILVLWGAMAVSWGATLVRIPVAPENAADCVVSLYLAFAMTIMVFVSASGATRMRTFFEAAPLKAGSWPHMLLLVILTLCAILLIVLWTGVVRNALAATEAEFGHQPLHKTWAYGLTRTMLALWLLLLGYRFKLIWDALTTHLDEFETSRWKMHLRPQTLKAKSTRLQSMLGDLLATERQRRGLTAKADDLAGLKEEQVIEKAIAAAQAMPSVQSSANLAAQPHAPLGQTQTNASGISDLGRHQIPWMISGVALILTAYLLYPRATRALRRE